MVEIGDMPDDVVYAIAMTFTDFHSLHRFSRICRRFARVVDERREYIYSAHSEIIVNDEEKSTAHALYGLLHRDGDLPASIDPESEAWYQHLSLIHI